MRKIVIIENITLDGVIQAPGGGDEDLRDSFRHGGWAPPYADEIIGNEMAKGFGVTELLFGRWTYEQFYSYWPQQNDGNPFTAILAATQKYVVSAAKPDLPWGKSTLVDGIDGVAELKASAGPDLVVLGSGTLAQSLLNHDLVDEAVLLIHPLLLGSGRRLFDGSEHPVTLQLTETVQSTTGVIIATYHRVAR